MPRQKKGTPGEITVSPSAIKDIYPAAVPRNDDGSVKTEATVTVDDARKIGAVSADSARYNAQRKRAVVRKIDGVKDTPWGETSALHLFDAIKEVYGITAITVYVQRTEPQPVHDYQPFKMVVTPDPAAFYDYVLKHCHQKSAAANYMIRFKEANGQERGRGHLHLPDTTAVPEPATVNGPPMSQIYAPYIPGMAPHMAQHMAPPPPWAPYPYAAPQPPPPSPYAPAPPPYEPPPAASAPPAPPAPAPPAPPAAPPAVGTLSGPSYPTVQPAGMDPTSYGMIAGALDAVRQTLDAVRQNQVQQATLLGEVQALRAMVQTQQQQPAQPVALQPPAPAPQNAAPSPAPMPFGMGGVHMPPAMHPMGVIPPGAPFGVPPVPGSYVPYPQPPAAPPPPQPSAAPSPPVPAAPAPAANPLAPLAQLQDLVKMLAGTQHAMAQIRNVLGSDDAGVDPDPMPNPLAGTLPAAPPPPEDDSDLRVVPLGMGADAPVLAYNKGDGSINMIGSLLGNVGQVPKILGAVEKMMRVAQATPQLPAIETVSEPTRPAPAAPAAPTSMIPANLLR